MRRLISILIAAVLFFLAPAFADSTGVDYPGTGADAAGTGTVTWASPGNATADDTSYSTATVTAINASHYLKMTNYGFSIPAGATINGITVEINKFQSGAASAGPADQFVYLVKAGTIQTSGSNKANTGTRWPASEAISTYGSTSDLWGNTWADTDINDSGFGVALAINSNSSRIASVDYIRITIEYTPAGANTETQRMQMMGISKIIRPDFRQEKRVKKAA